MQECHTATYFVTIAKAGFEKFGRKERVLLLPYCNHLRGLERVREGFCISTGEKRRLI